MVKAPSLYLGDVLVRPQPGVPSLPLSIKAYYACFVIK